MTKNKTICFSIFFCIITHICFSQITQREPYYERLAEEKERQEREVKCIKSLEEYNEKGELISRRTFDKHGNIIRFISFNKSDYSSQIDVPSLKNRTLKNKLSLTYNTTGDLIRVRNVKEFIRGTHYGTGENDRQNNALPVMAGPWKLIKQKHETEWSYKYNSIGEKTEQHGPVYKERDFYSKNSFTCNETSQKWKIVFEYDSSGYLIKEYEYYPFDAKEPVFTRVLVYDHNKILKEETVFSGNNIVNNRSFSFKYDNINRLTERVTGSYKYQFLYDKNGNRTTYRKYYLLNGNITEQEEFEYDNHNNMTEDKQCTYEYEYDKRGVIMKVTKTKKSDNSKTTIKYKYYK